MESIENNKQAAVNFLELITARKIDEAFQKYVDLNGKHHNPYYPAGLPALYQGMKENDAMIPQKAMRVAHVLGDGDLVAVHFHLILDSYEMAVVHLFRFENHKIVEIWDVGMAISGESKNEDGAF